MSEFLLSIIIPTINRPSLMRAVESIPKCHELEVILVGGGCEPPAIDRPNVQRLAEYPRAGDGGHSGRNLALGVARGAWLAFMDDDDYYTEGAVNLMLEYCAGYARGMPCLFRMRRLEHGDVIWAGPNLERGNVGMQQVLCPNVPGHMPKFKRHYSADFDWTMDVVRLCAGVRFVDAITVESPAQNLGAEGGSTGNEMGDKDHPSQKGAAGA